MGTEQTKGAVHFDFVVITTICITAAAMSPSSLHMPTAAIKGAVNGLMREVLEEHLRAHLGAPHISPMQRDEEIENVILILKSYLK